MATFQIPEVLEGQNCGTCRRKDIISKKKIGKNIIYKFKINEAEWECYARVSRYSLLAIADECAPFFGFAKIGTAVFQFGNTHYTCSDAYFEASPITITKETDKRLRQRAQDYLVFRWIFAVPVHGIDLMLYRSKLCACFSKEEVEDKTCIEEDWFVDTIEDSQLRLKKNTNGRCISSLIHEVIRRINPQAIIYLNEINSRLEPY